MKKLHKPSSEEDAQIDQAINADPDTFEANADQFTRARRGRPPLDHPKTAISIRLDKDVVAYFKSTGKGWQSRINKVLRDVAASKDS